MLTLSPPSLFNCLTIFCVNKSRGSLSIAIIQDGMIELECTRIDFISPLYYHYDSNSLSHLRHGSTFLIRRLPQRPQALLEEISLVCSPYDERALTTEEAEWRVTSS